MRFAAPFLAAGMVMSALLAGCNGGGARAYPVRGKVEFKDGDVGLLAGSHVEFMQEADPLIRPSGKVTPGGSFAVETLLNGKIIAGAPEGKYKARIILGDESDEGAPKRKGTLIHKRYFDFATSGLSFTVPSGDYKVAVTAK